LLGALYLRGTRWFITSPEWQVLSSGFGVLFVLLVLPGGLGGLWVRLRDLVVRQVVGETGEVEPVVDAAPVPDDVATEAA
jgi:hypothetical protein